tara:strand:+ start:1722 stop:2498 length:777 start_codon:yes stop_codon:yes gene_type:complete
MTEPDKPRPRPRSRTTLRPRHDQDGYHVDTFWDADGKARCNAKLRKKETRCRRGPLRGEKRCKLHGGVTAYGPAHHRYKNGLYSSWKKKLDIPTAPRDDESHLDLRTGIESQMFVLDRCAERIAECDSPKFRQRARIMVDKVKAALAKGDVDALSAAVRALDSWVHDGLAEDAALQAMSATSSALSKQMEGAHRARMNALNAMNTEDAIQFMSTVVRFVREEVGQQNAQRIIERLDREVLGSRLKLGPQGPLDEPGPD